MPLSMSPLESDSRHPSRNRGPNGEAQRHTLRRHTAPTPAVSATEWSGGSAYELRQERHSADWPDGVPRQAGASR